MNKSLFVLILILSIIFSACGTQTVNIGKTVEEQNVTKHSTDIDTTIPIEKENESIVSEEAIFLDYEVDIIYPLINFGDKTNEEYLSNIKENTPEAIDVKLYEENNDYYVVTMMESDRQEVLAHINAEFDKSLSNMIHSDEYNYSITEVKYDDNFQNVTLLADRDLYTDKKESINFAMTFQLGLTCQMIQALNLVDISNRHVNIVVVDNVTDEVLFDSSMID